MPAATFVAQLPLGTIVVSPVTVAATTSNLDDGDSRCQRSSLLGYFGVELISQLLDVRPHRSCG